MDLVVVAPGVSTDRLRGALADDRRGRLLFVDQLTRCGVPTAEPAAADRLRVAVCACVCSLHAADRFRRRLPAGVNIDAVLVAGGDRQVVTEAGQRTVVAWADGRFGCPVSQVDPAADPLPPRY